MRTMRTHAAELAEIRRFDRHVLDHEHQLVEGAQQAIAMENFQELMCDGARLYGVWQFLALYQARRSPMRACEGSPIECVRRCA